MNKVIELNVFLEKQGFSTEHEYGDLGMTLDKGKDRFQTEVWLDDSKFFFGRYFMKGFDYESEREILRDHNNLNSSSKEHWVKMKKSIIDAGFNVEVFHE